MMESLKKDRFKKNTKVLIIGLCLFWILAGLWGIQLCYSSAKQWKAIQIQEIVSEQQQKEGLEVSRSSPIVQSEILKAGLDQSPYLFQKNISLAYMIFTVVTLMSFFVLYRITA